MRERSPADPPTASSGAPCDSVGNRGGGSQEGSRARGGPGRAGDPAQAHGVAGADTPIGPLPPGPPTVRSREPPSLGIAIRPWRCVHGCIVGPGNPGPPAPEESVDHRRWAMRRRPAPVADTGTPAASPCPTVRWRGARRWAVDRLGERWTGQIRVGRLRVGSRRCPRPDAGLGGPDPQASGVTDPPGNHGSEGVGSRPAKGSHGTDRSRDSGVHRNGYPGDRAGSRARRATRIRSAEPRTGRLWSPWCGWCGWCGLGLEQRSDGATFGSGQCQGSAAGGWRRGVPGEARSNGQPPRT